MNNPSKHIGSYQTDWLASNPVFYNEYTGKVSNNINDVIDFGNLEFHPQGLTNYLNFGYSVFEQTPVKGVKFLRHSSRLTVSDHQITIQLDSDPVEKLLNQRSQEGEVLDLLRNTIRRWENSVEGDIVIPTSGGYDSRILNEMILHKERIRSYTYGISTEQSKSYEVVYAQKIAEILGTKFEQIQIGAFHHFIEHWDSLFGISTHAHGMYQMEFYEAIRKKTPQGLPLLSGIIGDAWAGSVSIPSVNTMHDVFRLGYSHGVNADASQCLLKTDEELLHNYFTLHKEKLEDPRFRIIESMRFKIILLCYLLKVPAHLGFAPWSPFLQQDIALSMLTLPNERRKNRVWQSAYFKQRSLDVESLDLQYSKKNTLDKRAMYNVPLQPLHAKLLSELFRPAYIEWINKHIRPTNNIRDFIDTMLYYPKIGGLLKRMGVEDEKLKAYNAYLTLKPIETLIIKRNNS